MIFTINKKDYTLKNLWALITISDLMKVAAIEIEDEALEELLGKDIYVDEYTNVEMSYIRNVISILAKAPLEVLGKTDSDSLLVLWDAVVEKIKALYYLDLEKYKAKGIESIYFGGKKWYLPSVLKVEGDKPILCYKEPCKGIIEANNLIVILKEMKHKGIHTLKYLAALYLREEDEPVEYTEERVAEKAELFEELTMDIAWEIFFSTYFSGASLMINSLYFLNLPRNKVLRRLVKIKYLIIGYMQLLKLRLRVTYKQLGNLLFGKYVTSLIIWQLKQIKKMKQDSVLKRKIKQDNGRKNNK